MHIKLGDYGRYIATSIDTVTFEMDLPSPLRLMDVMYVLGLKKNPSSIAISKDCGYDVIFRKGKSFLGHNHETSETDLGSCEEPV